MRDDFRVLFLALAKTKAGIEHNPGAINASMPSTVGGGFEFASNGLRSVRQGAESGPCFRLPPHVIQDQTGIAVGGHFRDLGIESETARVVDYIDAEFEGALRDLRLVGIERKWDLQFVAQALEHRYEALPFFVRRNALRPGFGRFGADVDDVCTLLFEFESAGVGAIGVVITAPVGERVGRDVEDAHQERTFAQLNFGVAELPVEAFSGHGSHFKCPMGWLAVH